MDKKDTSMKVYCDIVQLYRNIEAVHRYATEIEATAAFMMKPALNCTIMRQALSKQLVYTTGWHDTWTPIYSTDGIVVVDALDRREGVTMEEAEDAKQKDVAIVNAYCCTESVTTRKAVNDAYWRLKDMGYKKVSMGGSVLMHQDIAMGDELRIGEAMLTGHLSGLRDKPFRGMANPWYVQLPVWKQGEHGVVIKQGFCQIGGFTDVETKCLNTEMTVLDMQTRKRFVTLQPDYYSLIRMGYNGQLAHAEVI